MVRPYAKTTYDGRVVDQITRAALEAVAERLDYADGLTLLQGSYNEGGVSASGGTHDGGGVVDLAPYEWEKKVRALRAVGFAAWHRPYLAGVWGEHIHAVLIGNEELSPAAKSQVADYYAHRDGLAGHAADTSWHPSPVPVFKMPAPPTRGKNVDAALDLLRSAKDGPAVRVARIKQAIDNLRGIKPW